MATDGLICAFGATRRGQGILYTSKRHLCIPNARIPPPTAAVSIVALSITVKHVNALKMVSGC